MSLMPQYYQIRCLSCGEGMLIPCGNPHDGFCSEKCKEGWTNRVVEAAKSKQEEERCKRDNEGHTVSIINMHIRTLSSILSLIKVQKVCTEQAKFILTRDGCKQ